MKDLLEEGRKIQETFKKNVLTEAITPTYRDQVNKEYIALASKAGTIGKFTFEPKPFNKGASQWEAQTEDGGDLVVFFRPFSHPPAGVRPENAYKAEPKFEVSVWTIYPNSQGIESQFGGSLDSDKKFIKSVNPSNDPKKDAAIALDYIKKFLTGTDLNNFLKSLKPRKSTMPKLSRGSFLR